jgi:hypothetical protein
VELKMPSYDSPIGGKRFSGPALREIDIPDESGYSQQPIDREQINAARRRAGGPPVDENAIRDFQARMQQDQDSPAELERQIQEAREIRKGKERLNDGARKRIEMLLGMTRSSRSFTIDGNTFELQTLQSKDMREAMAAASEYDGTIHSPFEIRRQLLARSLSFVAGVEVAQFIGSTSLDARLAFIDELDESLLNRFYDEYLELVKDARKKYAIKSNEEANEVIDDLKK